ncbi:hypothetical protein [Armatimonas sp.]|uniref:hypothetical protein n=1 Tax=Armatimonas sp. TaxID=1872638 RepID=UPI0037501EEE
MNDSIIIRMATETIQHLRHAIPVSSCPYMVPSYNALVTAARANHPDDVFLKVLSPLPTTGDDRDCISIAEITALFAQLAIALESLS